MIFLKEVGFSEKMIKTMVKNIPELIQEQLEKYQKIVIVNIKYLQDLGITKVPEAFMNYGEMFLMNPKDFEGIFNKYDRESLIKKIEKNVAIIEHL